VVMRERNIDFVRTQALADNPDDPEAVLKQLKAEIRIIMQYYELEVADSTGHWEVNVIADDESTLLPESAQTDLTEALGQIPVEVLTSENVSTALSIEIPSGIPSDQISTVAIGHAMRVLCPEIVLPKINCLPPLIKEIKEIKRSILLTAILAAMILLIMGLVTMVLIQRGDQMNARIVSQKPNNKVGLVADQRGALDAEIEQVEKIPKRLKEILATQKNVNWARVLTDIKDGIPENVSITQFDTRSDYSVSINGVALHSNGITTFLSRLNRSDYLDSVDLVKTDYKKSGQSGLSGHHVYEIRCQLSTSVGT
jgi:Tfp pilus assembly protein PilN